MKSIKILLASLLISASAFGQVDKTPEERATAQTEKMKKELALTPEQVEKVKVINLGIIQKNEGVKTSTMTGEEKKAAHKSNEEARDAMLKDVLTTEQFQKYQTIKAERVQMKATKADLKKANFNKVEAQPAPAKGTVGQAAIAADAAGQNADAAALAAMQKKNPKLAAMMAQAGMNPDGTDIAEAEQQKGADYRDPPEADYGDDYQAMVKRMKQLAGAGPLKTVYDPTKRVYKNVPTATQPGNKK
jgi:hypothetical protein